jgi:hypothetical protein
MRLRPDKKYTRQEEAKKRVEEWRSLSLQEQLESLNTRRGNSTRQRTKILAKAEASNVPCVDSSGRETEAVAGKRND